MTILVYLSIFQACCVPFGVMGLPAASILMVFTIIKWFCLIPAWREKTKNKKNKSTCPQIVQQKSWDLNQMQQFSCSDSHLTKYCQKHAPHCVINFTDRCKNLIKTHHGPEGNQKVVLRAAHQMIWLLLKYRSSYQTSALQDNCFL